MKAIVFHEYGAPEVLQVQEIEKPVPRAGEVLVRVRAASVNPADHYVMRGRPYVFRMMSGWTRPKVNGIGQDFAGVVEGVGSGVDALRTGDEVFGEVAGQFSDVTRSFAEYIRVSAASVVSKPSNVSFAEAAAVPLAGRTALHALRDCGRIQPGQHVLINGAGGGVGVFAVQLAKHFGATVTAVCSESKGGLLRELGADRIIDYRQQDFTAERVFYDLIVDMVSSQSVRRCRRVLARHGTYVWVGAPDTDRWLGPLRPMFAVLWMSVLGGRQRWRCAATPQLPDDLMFLARLLADGKLRPVIDRRYPLEHGADAIRYLEQGHACGKIVVEV